MYKFLDKWPEYSSDPADIRQFLTKPSVSLDLEWDAAGAADVLGLSHGELNVSVPFAEGLPYFKELLVARPDIEIEGHNVVSSDIMVLTQMGIHIPLDNVQDSILYHWLVNMFLCKASGKAAMDEEGGTEKRGRGFMNLGCFASMYTNFPHWKSCRGALCEGPCPTCKPMWYNALDCAAVAEGIGPLRRQAKLRGVDKLYPMHRELAWVLAQMQEYGVRIDVPYVYPRAKHPLGSTDGSSLDEKFRREKEEIAGTLPFNPRSPKAVAEWFKGVGIELENAQEETVREVVDDLGDAAPDELVALLDYKELGNGVDRWFEPQYRDENGWLQGYLDRDGFCHPRLNFFTSSARLACSSPNFQNIAKRRRSRKVCECGGKKVDHPTSQCAKFRGESVGKKIRRAVIAPPGWYIVRADLSNAENRVVLHQSGYTIPRELDLHAWVRDMSGLTEDMQISKLLGGARDAAKSIQHANNILEGLQLKSRDDLRKPRLLQEIKAGARIVHPTWTFLDRVVTFTGSNLSRRVFGDASWEHRREALSISEKYFARFPGVRDFQRRTSAQNEREGAVRTALGYCTLSFGDAEDRMKTGQGITQQQPVSHITKLALLNLWTRWKRDGLMRPVLQVHDEIICYVKESVDPVTAMGWIQEDMEVSMPEFPGLLVPAEPSYGPDWSHQST